MSWYMHFFKQNAWSYPYQICNASCHDWIVWHGLNARSSISNKNVYIISIAHAFLKQSCTLKIENLESQTIESFGSITQKGLNRLAKITVFSNNNIYVPDRVLCLSILCFYTILCTLCLTCVIQQIQANLRTYHPVKYQQIFHNKIKAWHMKVMCLPKEEEILQ